MIGRKRMSEIGQLLQHRPRPLIDPHNRMIVIFSAKAASRSLVIWFWHHLGHLQAAHDYSTWPHRYRNDVYYKSELYRAACRSDLSDYKVIRVVRDPYDRAISMYRHALRHGLIDNLAERWRRFRGTGPQFSFADFLGRLERTNLPAGNPHFRVQRHPVEDRLRAHFTIDVSRENLLERLAGIESELGLPPSNLSQSPWMRTQSRLDRRNAEHPLDVYNHPFTPAETRFGWPRYEAFLTDEARQRIAKLYDLDIRTYFQPPTLDRLQP